MQGDRGHIGTVTYVSHHLAKAAGLSPVNSMGQQAFANAFSLERGRNIQGILQGETIGITGPVKAQITVATNLSFTEGDEPGQPGGAKFFQPAGYLCLVGRDDFKTARAL